MCRMKSCWLMSLCYGEKNEKRCPLRLAEGGERSNGTCVPKGPWLPFLGKGQLPVLSLRREGVAAVPRNGPERPKGARSAEVSHNNVSKEGGGGK